MDPERRGGGAGREGVPRLGAPFPLTLVQRRAGLGRPCTEQVMSTLLPRGKESSSSWLSSMGSRSGVGDRWSPSGTLTRLVRGAQGLFVGTDVDAQSSTEHAKRSPLFSHLRELCTLPSARTLSPNPRV